MIRCSILVLLFALAACNGSPALESVHCTIDSNCPFEQCCVSGICVDPGPAGSCADVAEATSALVIAETVVAGETVPFSARLSDTHGRPVAGVAVTVAVESSCAECETVATLSETTDASGIVNGTFMSTRAEPKTFSVHSGGGGSASKMITVVAGDAVGLGFAGVVDTPVNQPLSAIAVTRVDAYGNPDAAPSLPLMDGLRVEVALADNPLDLGLWRSGAALAPASVTVTLQGKRVSIGDVSVPLIVHGVALSGRLASDTTPPFISKPFSITGPHFTSTMPDPLVAVGGQVQVEWSVTPQVDARIIDGNFLGPQFSKADSGASVFPTFVSGAAHVRVSELEPRSAYDVEAVQLSRGDGLFGTADTGAVIDRVHALPGGDVLALGRFWGELVLTPSARITGISGYTSTYQSFIARFSNDFTQVRWYAATYGFSAVTGAATGAASIIRDSEVTTDGGVLVVTQFTADATGWDYQAGGVRRRCVASGGGTRAGASLARLNVDTGDLAYCASLHDPSLSTAMLPRSMRTLGQQHYVALTVASNVGLYGGTSSPGAGDPVFSGDLTPPYVIPADLGKHDCGTASVGLIVPLLDNASTSFPVSVGPNFVTTQVLVQADSMEVDAAGTGLNIGATVCSAGSSLQSGTGMNVTTTSNDGMILHLSGQTLTPVWQSTCAGDDGPTRATALEDGTYAVMMNFLGVCSLDPHQAGSPSGGIAVGRVRSSRGLTASSILSSAGAVVGRGFERRGDRIVFSAYAAADLTIAGTPYAGVHGTGVIMLAETDANFIVRWSSPSTNMNGSSGAFDLMENGRTLVTMNGSPQTMKAAALDAIPPAVPSSTGTLRPIVYTLDPYDFVLRDVR